jgi:hypothetical protein
VLVLVLAVRQSQFASELKEGVGVEREKGKGVWRELYLYEANKHLSRQQTTSIANCDRH